MWISKKEILELSEGIQKAIEGESFDPRDEKEGPWSIFKNDIYCIAGVIGVTILWFIYPIIGMESAQFITLIIIVLIRMISYYKTINLPVICKERV